MTERPPIEPTDDFGDLEQQARELDRTRQERAPLREGLKRIEGSELIAATKAVLQRMADPAQAGEMLTRVERDNPALAVDLLGFIDEEQLGSQGERLTGQQEGVLLVVQAIHAYAEGEGADTSPVTENNPQP